MGFIKRAILYCRRQKLRTMLLFFILMLAAAFLLTGTAIRNASVEAAAKMQTAIGAKILLEPDSDGHMDGGQANEWGGTTYTYNGDLITPEIVDAIRHVEGVADYNAEDTGGYHGAGVDFQYIPAALGLSYTPYGESSDYTATLSSEKCSHFQSGKYKLTAGRHITPEDAHVCLISKELAEYNRLSPGDKINMYSLDSDAVSEFEIVGIFDGTEGTSGNALTVEEIPANCGYIDYATLFELYGDDLDGYQQLTIYVEDPLNVQTVYDKISSLPELKGKTLKLRINTEEYDTVSTPLESLQKLADTAILTGALAGAAILTLLLTIWVRGRKREIGILLSMGKRKTDILAQYFTETGMTAFAAFTASIPVSYLAAGQANAFLASRTATDTMGLHIQIFPQYLCPVYIIGALLTAFAVSVSSWTVLRLKPKDILTKMR